VVVDIGANDGALARRFADAVGPAGLVVAVEPDHVAAEKCRKTCAGKSVVVKEVAVSDEAGEHEWYQANQSVQNSLYRENVPRLTKVSTVTTTTLDALLEDIGRPVRAIKIDAQGAEAAIVHGGSRALASQDLRWMIEVWPEGLRVAGSSVEALAQTYEASGWVIVAEGKEPKPSMCTWAQLLDRVKDYTGHRYTNVILARA
jgi:FkbM family methyltransferase